MLHKYPWETGSQLLSFFVFFAPRYSQNHSIPETDYDPSHQPVELKELFHSS